MIKEVKVVLVKFHSVLTNAGPIVCMPGSKPNLKLLRVRIQKIVGRRQYQEMCLGSPEKELLDAVRIAVGRFCLQSRRYTNCIDYCELSYHF